MFQPAAPFCKVTVQTADSTTLFSFSLSVNFAGSTTWARSPVTVTCHGLPYVRTPLVEPICLLLASLAFHQSEHAVAPCQTKGSNSSTMTAWGAHDAVKAFMSPLFWLSASFFTLASTSALSDARAGVPTSGATVAAM